ncbi:MAG: entericidin A/B family lipoprotein [Gammaproteobacteria bacterium]
MKIQAILLSLVVASIALLTGCQNTAAGFGKDMQNTGQAIEKSVNEK